MAIGRDSTFKATVKPTTQRRPFEIGTDASIVQILEQAIAARMGHKPSHTGQAFWTDAALLVEASMDTVLLGPSGHGLHSA